MSRFFERGKEVIKGLTDGPKSPVKSKTAGYPRGVETRSPEQILAVRAQDDQFRAQIIIENLAEHYMDKYDRANWFGLRVADHYLEPGLIDRLGLTPKLQAIGNCAVLSVYGDYLMGKNGPARPADGQAGVLGTAKAVLIAASRNVAKTNEEGFILPELYFFTPDVDPNAKASLHQDVGVYGLEILQAWAINSIHTRTTGVSGTSEGIHPSLAHTYGFFCDNLVRLQITPVTMGINDGFVPESGFNNRSMDLYHWVRGAKLGQSLENDIAIGQLATSFMNNFEPDAHDLYTL